MDIRETPHADITPPEPPLPRRRVRRSNGRALVIAAIAVVVAAGVGTAVAVTSHSSGAPAVASTITVTGSLTLVEPVTFLLADRAFVDTTNTDTTPYTIGDNCAGINGYSDIAGGAQIVIGDGDGHTVAVGQLETGVVQSSTGGDGGRPECQFDFAIPAPSGHQFYTVTVAHRGTTVYTAAQAQSGVALTLGG